MHSLCVIDPLSCSQRLHSEYGALGIFPELRYPSPAFSQTNPVPETISLCKEEVLSGQRSLVPPQLQNPSTVYNNTERSKIIFWQTISLEVFLYSILKWVLSDIFRSQGNFNGSFVKLNVLEKTFKTLLHHWSVCPLIADPWVSSLVKMSNTVACLLAVHLTHTFNTNIFEEIIWEKVPPVWYKTGNTTSRATQKISNSWVQT